MMAAHGDLARGTSRVYDTGYHAYTGPRLGGVAPVLSLARWSAGRALGLRQSWKLKVIPALMFLIAMVPALIVIGIAALVPAGEARQRITASGSLIDYVDYYGLVDLVMLIGAGAVVPLLLSPDRRYRVTGLYFATAVGRDGYVIAKVLAAVVPLLALTCVPMLTLFAGNVLLAPSASDYVADNAAAVPRILLIGVLTAGFYGMLGLFVASFSSRAAIAAGAFVGGVLASGAVASVLVRQAGLPDAFALLSLRAMPEQTAAWIFDAESTFVASDFGPGGAVWFAAMVAVIALAAAAIVVRYRREAV